MLTLCITGSVYGHDMTLVIYYKILISINLKTNIRFYSPKRKTGYLFSMVSSMYAI